MHNLCSERRQLGVAECGCAARFQLLCCFRQGYAGASPKQRAPHRIRGSHSLACGAILRRLAQAMRLLSKEMFPHCCCRRGAPECEGGALQPARPAAADGEGDLPPRRFLVPSAGGWARIGAGQGRAGLAACPSRVPAWGSLRQWLTLGSPTVAAPRLESARTRSELQRREEGGACRLHAPLAWGNPPALTNLTQVRPATRPAPPCPAPPRPALPAGR